MADILQQRRSLKERTAKEPEASRERNTLGVNSTELDFELPPRGTELTGPADSRTETSGDRRERPQHKAGQRSLLKLSSDQAPPEEEQSRSRLTSRSQSLLQSPQNPIERMLLSSIPGMSGSEARKLLAAVAENLRLVSSIPESERYQGAHSSQMTVSEQNLSAMALMDTLAYQALRNKNDRDASSRSLYQFALEVSASRAQHRPLPTREPGFIEFYQSPFGSQPFPAPQQPRYRPQPEPHQLERADSFPKQQWQESSRAFTALSVGNREQPAQPQLTTIIDSSLGARLVAQLLPSVSRAISDLTGSISTEERWFLRKLLRESGEVQSLAEQIRLHEKTTGEPLTDKIKSSLGEVVRVATLNHSLKSSWADWQLPAAAEAPAIIAETVDRLRVLHGLLRDQSDNTKHPSAADQARQEQREILSQEPTVSGPEKMPSSWSSDFIQERFSSEIPYQRREELRRSESADSNIKLTQPAEPPRDRHSEDHLQSGAPQRGLEASSSAQSPRGPHDNLNPALATREPSEKHPSSAAKSAEAPESKLHEPAANGEAKKRSPEHIEPAAVRPERPENPAPRVKGRTDPVAATPSEPSEAPKPSTQTEWTRREPSFAAPAAPPSIDQLDEASKQQPGTTRPRHKEKREGEDDAPMHLPRWRPATVPAPPQPARWDSVAEMPAEGRDGSDAAGDFTYKPAAVPSPDHIPAQATWERSPDRELRPQKAYTVTGRVYDSQSGYGVQGVFVSGGFLGNAVTDKRGMFSFMNVPQGFTYTLSLSKKGYRIAPSSRTATADGPNHHTFRAKRLMA
ncbi:MAG: hypothetical protein J5J00_00170 [Deltaproteobacteria bacterium]|nr:hypothetical protein [Deltaproteobacteria bacterium]